MPIHFELHPIDILVNVISEQYPDIDVPVYFTSFDEGECGRPLGRTVWPDDGAQPFIELDFSLPIYGVLDILAHEIAHMVCGADEGHGENWGATYRNIHERYVEKVSALADDGEGAWVEFVLPDGDISTQGGYDICVKEHR